MYRHQVLWVKTPAYDELAVPKIMEMVVKDKALCKFLPDECLKKKLPDRSFLMNLINTQHTEYLRQIVQHAQAQRFGQLHDEDQNNKIVITEEWLNELQAHPYSSSKLNLMFALNFFLSQLPPAEQYIFSKLHACFSTRQTLKTMHMRSVLSTFQIFYMF